MSPFTTNVKLIKIR